MPAPMARSAYSPSACQKKVPEFGLGRYRVPRSLFRSLPGDPRHAPIVVTEQTRRRGQVHFVEFFHRKAAFLEQIRDRSVQVAATGEFLPHRVDAVLPLAHAGVGRADPGCQQRGFLAELRREPASTAGALGVFVR